VLAASSTIKDRPKASVLGVAVGDPIDLDVAAYQRLAHAFLDAFEKRFPDR